jgi:hypothetical protein
MTKAKKEAPPVLCCVPVGTKGYKPGGGYRQVHCEFCQNLCWLGPNQQAVRIVQGGVVSCAACAVKGGAKMKNVQHLGGGLDTEYRP